MSGRNAISWEDKFARDVEYVDRRSFTLDTLIMCRTVGTVLRRDGISDAAGPTMTEFRGGKGGA